jgi:hypothetical protein
MEALLDSSAAAALLRIHPKTLIRMARKVLCRPFASEGCGCFVPPNLTPGSHHNEHAVLPRGFTRKGEPRQGS